MIKKLNLWLSKRLEISYLSSLETYKFSTSWNFWVEQHLWREIASEIKKKFFPYELSDSANKLENEELPPYEAFFSKLRNNNPLDRDFKDYQKLRSSGLDEQKVLEKFQIKSVPASGWENYKY